HSQILCLIIDGKNYGNQLARHSERDSYPSCLSSKFRVAGLQRISGYNYLLLPKMLTIVSYGYRCSLTPNAIRNCATAACSTVAYLPFRSASRGGDDFGLPASMEWWLSLGRRCLRYQ